MSDLTEAEIFDAMGDALGKAISLCGKLAAEPARGRNYDALRKELGLIEGCCRQAAMWRGDARWLPIGVFMEKLHQTAGSWLRVRSPPTLFFNMEAQLRATLKISQEVRHRATGVLGPILPEALPAPHRDTRPVQVLLPGFKAPVKGNILLPRGFGE